MLQVAVVVAFFAASAIYAAPSVIAIMKGRRRWLLVVALNLLLGWSIVGWLLALAMAVGYAPRRPAWTKRKPRVKRASGVSNAAAPGRALQDPPPVRDDAYADWLEQGAALGNDPRGSNSV